MEIETKHLIYFGGIIVLFLLFRVGMAPKVVKTVERGSGISSAHNKSGKKDDSKNMGVTSGSKVSDRSFSEIHERSSISTINRSFIKTDELTMSGNFDEVINELIKIVNNADSNPYLKAEAMYKLARMYMVMKDFKSAEAYFKKFLTDYPSHKEVQNAKMALEYMKNYEIFKGSFVSFEKEIQRRR